MGLTPAHQLSLGAGVENSNGDLTSDSKQGVTQATHGFAVLDVLRHNGTNWVKAQADSEANLGFGIVVEVVDTNTFFVAQVGLFTISSHGLTPGTYYFLSDSVAGDLTSTAPSGFVQKLVLPVDANNVAILPYEGIAPLPTPDPSFNFETTYEIRDDFGGGRVSGDELHTFENEWDINDSSGGNYSWQNHDGERVGILRFTTNAVSNNKANITAGTRNTVSMFNFNAVSNLTITASVKLAQTTQQFVFIGLSINPEPFGSPTTTDRLGIEIDTDVNANWRGVEYNSGAVYSGSTGTADTNWVKVRMSINNAGDTAEFFVNDVSIGTVPITLTGTAYPIIGIVTRTSSAKTMDADYFHLVRTGLSR